MSELPTGAYAPGNSPGDDPSKAKQVAAQSKEAAGQAAADVKGTATQQAQRVGAEARTQARNVAGEVRDRFSEQARTQNDRLVGTIRQTADQLDEMRGERSESPAATVVSRVADGGRQLADYLDRNGPDGVLREVQDFARRRPGAFLATALAAGFVVGRLGKSVAQADPNAGVSGKPAGDSFTSDYETPGAGYPATTGNPAPSSGGAYQTPATSSGDGYQTPATRHAAPATDPVTGTSTAAGGVYGGTEYAATGTGRPAAVPAEGVPVTGPGTASYSSGQYPPATTTTAAYATEDYPAADEPLAGREPRP